MSIISGRVALQSGVAAKLGTGVINAPIMLKAGESNSASIFIGNDGNNTVASGTGFELAAGDQTTFDRIGKLDDIYVIAYAAGQYIYWHSTEN